jgi:hypothetical protein
LRVTILPFVLALSFAGEAMACGCLPAENPTCIGTRECAEGCLAVCAPGTCSLVCDGSVPTWPPGFGDPKRVLHLGAALSSPSRQEVAFSELLILRSGDTSYPLSAWLRAATVGSLATPAVGGAPLASIPLTLGLRHDSRLDPLFAAMAGKSH